MVAVAAVVDAAAIVEIVAATAEIAATAGKTLRSFNEVIPFLAGVAFTLPENL
jgi:hypothetical protein